MLITAGKNGKKLKDPEDGAQIAFGNTSDLLGLVGVPSIVIIHPSSKSATPYQRDDTSVYSLDNLPLPVILAVCRLVMPIPISYAHTCLIPVSYLSTILFVCELTFTWFMMLDYDPSAV